MTMQILSFFLILIGLNYYYKAGEIYEKIAKQKELYSLSFLKIWLSFFKLLVIVLLASITTDTLLKLILNKEIEIVSVVFSVLFVIVSIVVSKDYEDKRSYYRMVSASLLGGSFVAIGGQFLTR
jgi:hypothetical protein